MANSDNTADLAENKILILYFLDQLPKGIVEDTLYKIVASVNGVNYFYFKQVLTDLIDTKLIGLLKNEENEDAIIKITSEGKNALSLTKDILPGIVKLKADSLFKEELTSIENETSITAEFIPKNENDYTIKCKIIENNETIFEVKTIAGSRDRAKRIVDNWKSNASKIYPEILDILLKSSN